MLPGVRFIQKSNVLYAILLGVPSGDAVTLSGLRAEPGMTATLLGFDAPVTWRQTGDGITFSFPAAPPALKLVPQPAKDTPG